MSGNANPVDLVVVDGVDVAKTDLRTFVRDRVSQRMADATEVRNTSLSGQKGLIIGGVEYYLDTSDTTTADDGVSCIIDADGNRFKRVTGVTPNPRGAWSSGTTYQIGDAVSENGASYINLTADNLNNDPEANPSDWMLWAADGATGPSGTSRQFSARFVAMGNVDLAGGGLAAGTVHDGVTAVGGDFVLVGKQSTFGQNGIYTVPASGAASRHTDFDGYDDYPAVMVSVEDGSLNKGSQWQCTSVKGGVLGTTALTFERRWPLDSIFLEPDPFPLIGLKPTFWWHPKAHARADSKFSMSITAAQAFGANGLLQSTAAGQPRISYQYQTGERLGYRVEGIDRVQLATAPRDLTNAAWTKTSCSASKNALGIDGASNAATTLTAGGANATCTQSITSASAKRAVSVWLKRGSGTGTIQITADGSAWTTVTLNNNFQEFRIAIATITDPVIGIKIVTSGDIVIVDYFECKTDNYSLPNPASTGTVTADVITFPMPSYNTALGNWLYFRGIVFPNGVAQSLICFDTGGTTTRLELGIDTSNLIHLWVSNGGSLVVDISLPEAVTSGQEVVIAARLKVNDYRLSGRGFTTAVDTSGAMPAAMTTARLGRNSGGEGAVCDYVKVGFGTGDIDDTTLDQLLETGDDVLDDDVTALKLLAKDASNKEFARALRSRAIGNVAAPTRKYNLVLIYGQSQGEAAQSRTRITGNSLGSEGLADKAGTLMIGDDIRRVNSDDTGFTVIGLTAFNALKAQVLSPDDPFSVIADAAAAALAYADGNPGESAGISLARVLKTEMERWFGLEDSTDQEIVVVDCSVGGKSLNELIESHTDGTIEYFNLIAGGTNPGALEVFSTLAASNSHHVVAIVYFGNETDQLEDHGITNRAGYKTRIGDMRDAIVTHAKSQGGNALDPLFVIVPPSAGFIRDTDLDGNRDIFVDSAEWEYARENAGTVVLGPPYYRYTDVTNQHMDANGQRWIGCKLAQILARCLLERKQHHGASVLEVEWIDPLTLWVHLDLPCPAVQSVPSYSTSDATTYAETTYTQLGWRLIDGGGNQKITVSIVADTILQIALSRTPTGTVYLQYGTEAAHNGNGNIADSDPYDPGMSYRYDAATGMSACSNIPALVDEPYDMANPLMHFSEDITTGWSRRTEL